MASPDPSASAPARDLSPLKALPAPGGEDGPAVDSSDSELVAAFAAALVRARHAIALSRAELASATMVFPSTVHRWEEAGALPSDPALTRIVEATGCRDLVAVYERAVGRGCGRGFGRALFAARLTAGVTVSMVARTVGVPGHVVRAWEMSRALPRVSALPKLVEAVEAPGLVEVWCAYAHPEVQPGSLAETVLVGRARVGWSREVLARACGVHRNTIAGWEAGRVQPDPEKARVALAELGESIPEGLQGRERPTGPGPAGAFPTWLSNRVAAARTVLAGKVDALAEGRCHPSAADVVALAEGGVGNLSLIVELIVTDIGPVSSAPYASAGARLLRARLRSGRSVASLAERCGVVPSAWRRWERGLVRPAPSAIAVITVELGPGAVGWGSVAAPPAGSASRAAAAGGVAQVHRLTGFRQERGWSMADLAGRAEVAVSTVAAWESSRAEPSERARNRLRDLGAPV